MSTPTVTPSDPQAMPLADLKTAAGLNAPPDPAPAAAAPTPAPTPAPIVPEPFSVQQDDSGVTIQMSPEFGGEVFKGKDWAEVGPKIAKAKADANAYIKQLKTQPQAPPQPTPTPAPVVDPAVQATRDWLLAETAAALNMSPDEYKRRVGMVFNTTDKMVEQTAFVEFHKLCPDFVDSPENGSVVGSYFPDNYKPADPITFANDLKTAYALALLDGKIVRHSAQPQAPAARPPVMPTAGTSGTSGEQSAWTMPLDQLKQQAGLG